MVVTAIGFILSIPGQTVGISVFTPHLMGALDLSAVELTSAYLVGTALSGLLIPVGGRQFDVLGGRQYTVLVSLLFGLTLFYMSQLVFFSGELSKWIPSATSASFLAATFGFWGIRFLGQGLVTVAARSTLAKWWDAKRGQITAINGIAISFAFSSAPRILDWQIQWLGWQGALFLNGGLVAFVGGLVGWLFVRDNPEECGLEIDGGRVVRKRENSDSFFVRDLTREEALKTYAFWLISLSVGFHALMTTAYTFHVIDIAETTGVDREWILNMFIFSSFLSITISFIAGYLVDFVRMRWIAMVFSAGGCIFSLAVLFLGNPFSGFWLLLGMGLSWGTFPVLLNIPIPRYFGRAHIGAISGVNLLFIVWGSAAGPLVFTLLKDFSGDYKVAFLLCAIFYLLLLLGSCFMRNPQKFILSV